MKGATLRAKLYGCSVAGAVRQMQNVRRNMTGVAVQVQRHACSIAGTILQAQRAACNVKAQSFGMQQDRCNMAQAAKRVQLAGKWAQGEWRQWLEESDRKGSLDVRRSTHVPPGWGR